MALGSLDALRQGRADAGSTTASAFTLNPLDEPTGETRSDGGTATAWTKTNFDPAGNPTDRCTWSANPGTELCKAVGQTFTPPPPSTPPPPTTPAPAGSAC